MIANHWQDARVRIAPARSAAGKLGQRRSGRRLEVTGFTWYRVNRSMPDTGNCFPCRAFCGAVSQLTPRLSQQKYRLEHTSGTHIQIDRSFWCKCEETEQDQAPPHRDLISEIMAGRPVITTLSVRLCPFRVKPSHLLPPAREAAAVRRGGGPTADGAVVTWPCVSNHRLGFLSTDRCTPASRCWTSWRICFRMMSVEAYVTRWQHVEQHPTELATCRRTSAPGDRQSSSCLSSHMQYVVWRVRVKKPAGSD
ncbi:hypothetical protein HPP92_015976 [Vanilla planifolia]|uniref:Uncharacterized protein n=1 Tax=Vanilla planifolia TaxID=51239 RepID=A0A835USX3_VANPL|nr:hypothetical protein HPP92_016558 [Vanilla planifolia]KAG0471430.1 hypothetical protein HPP92_015976 [Vanilla planifolia]